MPVKKFKQLILCLNMVLSCVLVFSGCDKSETLSEKTNIFENKNFTDSQLIVSETKQQLTETTTVAQADTKVPQIDTIIAVEETTEKELTSEEIELINNMPDIVFVLSHKWSYSSQREDYYSNIRGFYITKSGEIKMYAFSDDEPNMYVIAICNQIN